MKKNKIKKCNKNKFIYILFKEKFQSSKFQTKNDLEISIQITHSFLFLKWKKT